MPCILTLSQRRQDLLRALHAIPISRHRPETIVHRDIPRTRRLKLLQQSHIPSPGSNNTGTRFIVAAAAPVIMFVAPGPMELVQTIVRRRLLILAEAAEVCTMACSLRAS